MLRNLTSLLQGCKVSEVTQRCIRSIPLPVCSQSSTTGSNILNTSDACQRRDLHSTAALQVKFEPPKNWLKMNEIVFPPTKEGEPERPAEIYHQRAHIKYSALKLNYLTRMIRGMSIDEAIKQLSFKEKKGSQILVEILEEARDLAVAKHNVEFKSNLWIAEAFPCKAGYIQGTRKHARGRFGRVHYRYTHMFVKLREGKPPEHYYQPALTGHQNTDKYIQKMRSRRLLNVL